MWVLHRIEDGFEVETESASVACIISAEVSWLCFEEEI